MRKQKTKPRSKEQKISSKMKKNSWNARNRRRKWKLKSNDDAVAVSNSKKHRTEVQSSIFANNIVAKSISHSTIRNCSSHCFTGFLSVGLLMCHFDAVDAVRRRQKYNKIVNKMKEAEKSGRSEKKLVAFCVQSEENCSQRIIFRHRFVRFSFFRPLHSFSILFISFFRSSATSILDLFGKWTFWIDSLRHCNCSSLEL